jgi:hypothetical protein
MELTIRIKCDNAAFGSSGQETAEEVLRVISADLEKVCCNDTAGVTLRDSNGNKVGTMVAEW